MELKVKILENEYWWGGSSEKAMELPITDKSEFFLDMYNGHNQTMPLFVSSKGRYIWSDKPMQVKVSGGEFSLESETDIILKVCGDCLRDAYLCAMKAHFPFTGKVPTLKFFETAQYNTWAEFDYNQNQENILKYAHAIVDNGYTPGVIMIDEGWHTRYGLWEFDFTKFPDPKAMVDELHALGFKVMLWVVPLVTCDGQGFIMQAYSYLKFLKGAAGDRELFLRNDDGNVSIVRWWNGYSAILNFCKKDDRDYLDGKLHRLMDEYGIDGFKFDGGNISMYNPKNIINGVQTKYSADELNIAWNEFGARYEYHEYKDTYKGGGKPVIQRLQDRHHTWVGHGIDTVIPSALVQGLLGHPFICPDMIGGGEWSFNYRPDFKVDEELFVRMAQCSALFPMMQFSWAPWRMLSEGPQKDCLNAAKLHAEYASKIVELVKESAVSGEPILRHMAYEYPHAGYEEIDDQFMLGSDILVAPVINQGEVRRKVVLPEGKWLYCGKTEFEGGCEVEVPAPIDVLPYFVKA